MAAVKAHSRWPRRLANLLLLALVLNVAVIGARVTWLLVWDDKPLPLPAQQNNSSSASTRGLVSMAAHAVFGKPDRVAPVAEVVRENAPETRLNLRLEGVLLGRRPEESGAIVAGSNGVTEHYRVGDSLPGNATLAEVEAGRILIRRNGQYESLTFDEQYTADIAESVEAPSVNEAEQFVLNAREQLAEQGVAALTPYGLRPADDAGGGYIYDGSSALLNAVGLQSGDTITSINGQPLGNFDRDLTLLDNWQDQSQLDIEIERGGAILTVSYAIPDQWR